MKMKEIFTAPLEMTRDYARAKREEKERKEKEKDFEKKKNLLCLALVSFFSPKKKHSEFKYLEDDFLEYLKKNNFYENPDFNNLFEKMDNAESFRKQKFSADFLEGTLERMFHFFIKEREDFQKEKSEK